MALALKRKSSTPRQPTKLNVVPPEPYPLFKRLILPLMGLVIMVGALVYVLYFAEESVHSHPIPVIKADPAPFRVRPEDPGGTDVPHRDKLVYQCISSATPSAGQAEQLLPPPEAPLERPTATAAACEEAPPAPLAKTPAMTSASPGKQPTPLPKPVMTAKPSLKPTPKLAKPVTVKEKPLSPPVSADKTWQIQLGAGRSLPAMRALFQQLRQRHGRTLASLRPLLIPTLLPEKGMYFRLCVGPFATHERTQQVAAQLQRAKIPYKIIERPNQGRVKKGA